MTIGWFPGHMHKASKELDKALLKTHVIIEVLDARAP
ncbi:ribosome biogenesis GTPase YlqF, partial [OM182 bacterium]|nr:ribosome biogenesis GTPase YlqF [OM182 bacterium]